VAYVEGCPVSELRRSTLAAQERDQALQLIDNAIELVVPHINDDVLVQSEEKRGTGKGEPKLVIIKVEEWQARMKACQVLVSDASSST
jgi:hypothetical protein